MYIINKISYSVLISCMTINEGLPIPVSHWRSVHDFAAQVQTCADFQNSPSPNHHLTTHQQPSSKPQPNNPNSTKHFSTFLRAKMASPYSAQDQAADLGIHRVHNLVLGDPRKEARLARFSPPQLKRPVLGRGDVRMAEHQYEWETRRELERIARRHNLKAYVSPHPKILSDDNLFLSFSRI
jgi:hypothetical protein